MENGQDALIRSLVKLLAGESELGTGRGHPDCQGADDLVVRSLRIPGSLREGLCRYPLRWPDLWI